MPGSDQIIEMLSIRKNPAKGKKAEETGFQPLADKDMLVQQIDLLREDEFLFLGWQNMHGHDLQGLNLRFAFFEHANLSEANLDHACLKSANFQNADLRNASLRFADFSGADTTNMNIDGADLTGAIITRAQLQSTTGIPKFGPSGPLPARKLRHLRP